MPADKQKTDSRFSPKGISIRLLPLRSDKKCLANAVNWPDIFILAKSLKGGEKLNFNVFIGKYIAG